MATSTSKPSQVGNNFYQTTVTTNADGSLKATTFRTDEKGTTQTPVSTVTTDTSGKSTRTFESGATASEKTAFSNPNSQERKAYSDQVKSVEKDLFGSNPTNTQQQTLNAAAGNKNTATNTNNTGDSENQQGGSLNEGQSKALAEENQYKENTRFGDNAYRSDLKYPINLKAEVQDTIRFSILEYSPSFAKKNLNQGGNGQFGSSKKRIVTLESSGIPIVSGSKRIGTITLPIPAGISDGNTVAWQDDRLNQLQQSAAEVAQGFLTGGVSEAAKSVENQAEKLKAGANTGDLQSAVTSLFIGSTISNANIAARTYGAVGNNNLELLFNGPGLRSFGFTFSFYPRSKSEAVMVRRIIRAFKQAMSVKRSATSLLLKAPHTFAISYVTAGQKQHPYLNSFKECALTSCSVDYTPDGTYMTYGGTSDDDRSMTAYRLTLQFQELEPVFDDEYYEIDKNDDKFIGF